MPDVDFDVIVLGGGPGGYATALRAAGFGLKVAIVERDKVGGTCLHRGCIPTKALLHAAEIRDSIAEASHYGITVDEPKVDWEKVVEASREPTDKHFKGLQGLIKSKKITMIDGDGAPAGPGTVKVKDKSYTASDIVIAVGSYARSLPGLEPDGEKIITSDHALRQTWLPSSVCVVGSGAVGVEFASVWRSFGVDVTVVEALDRMVPVEDADISKEFAAAYKRRGIKTHVSSKVVDADTSGEGVKVTIEGPDGKTSSLTVDQVLVAVGRGPNSESVDLSSWNVKVDRGHVVTDEFMSAGDGVWAVGDCVAGVPKLAHAAFAMGIGVAARIAGEDPDPVDYTREVPGATYSVPEVASVGLTEAKAKEAGYNVKSKKHMFGGIAKAEMVGDGKGFCKIVFEEDGPVLGVHMIGPRVTENIAEALLAVGWEAFPEEIARLIHPHPTLSEVIGEAAMAAIGRPLHG